MCQIGDIIIIKKYKDRGEMQHQHAFLVISEEQGKINNIPYNINCNVISAFKDEDHKIRKMRSPGNFPIVLDAYDVEMGNSNEGYIKADQIFYFQKENIEYEVIGKVASDKFNSLLAFILESEFEILDITENIY